MSWVTERENRFPSSAIQKQSKLTASSNHDQTTNLTRTDIRDLITRPEVCTSEAEAVDGAGFVSEAAVEDIGIKQALFARLEQYVDRHTILASNTSTYPMTQITRDMTYRDRALVTHPFNPPHLLPVVEVVPGEDTSAATVSAAMTLLEYTGKRPVRLNREMPGFLITRIQMSMLREIWDLLDQSLASPEDIDAAVRGSLGLRLVAIGPLGVCDFAGLDIWARIFDSLATEISTDTQIPQGIRDLVENGHYGTKSGRGFLITLTPGISRLGPTHETAASWRSSNCFTPGESSGNKPSSVPYSRPRASRAPSTITLSLCRATAGSSGTRPQSGATWI